MADCISISGDLARQGWAVRENYFPAALIAELHHDLGVMQQGGYLLQAGIGRGARQIHTDIRNDVTMWLNGENSPQKEYLHLMESLRKDLNQALVLGLFEFEAHYALYPSGGFYQKHIDALKGQRNRIVSTVTYLTPGWRAEDAGQLVLYDPEEHSRVRASIIPHTGTLVVFMSEDIPHEVLSPRRPRSSIAGWFRCRDAF